MTQPPEAQPPPGGAPKGIIAGTIAQVFAYIDAPWKAVVVVVLVLIGGAGWVIYEKRDELFARWLTPSEASFKRSEVAHALDELVSGTGADLVQIWKVVDHNANMQSYIDAERRDHQRPVIPEPRDLPIIDRDSTVQDIGAVLDVTQGHPRCIDLSETGAPLSRRLAGRGMNRGCAVPIGARKTFVGIIYLAWETAPDKSDENVAVVKSQAIAGQLLTH